MFADDIVICSERRERVEEMGSNREWGKKDEATAGWVDWVVTSVMSDL